MRQADKTAQLVLKRLKGQIFLTRVGLVAERVTKAFWPFIATVFFVLAALMFGLHEVLPLEAVWVGAVIAFLGVVASLVFAWRRFRWPSAEEALARLDITLPGRPLSAIMDEQAIGADDPASQAVWEAHVERMAAQARKARAPAPDLRVARRDPYALRYVATLALVMALLFGSALRVASVSEIMAGGDPGAVGGPSWEGWVQPPGYTGKPTIYLADIQTDGLAVPEGSQVTLRLYGEVGDLTISETVSDRTEDIGSAAATEQSFKVVHSGQLSINGPGGQNWEIEAIPDATPEISLSGEVERGVGGEMRMPFSVRDDYGIVSGWADIELDLPAVDRRFGLAADPEPREKITVDLPIPFTGDRREFSETLIENLSQHPWAGLPVQITLYAQDAAGQIGSSGAQPVIMPGRRFFDPLAAAIVEQRRDLLWSRANGKRIARILRAVSHRPEDVFDEETAYLKLRVVIRQLERAVSGAGLTTAEQQEIASVLWDIALGLEEGSLADARERLRQARERLQQAMRDGASDEEIAELMDELREAMRDYMEQLAQEQQQGQDEPADSQNAQIITDEQLQQMMDRIQELMEQGRMSEAQDLLDQLAEMMENLQMAEGEGSQGPGQQAMEGLAETLREQQDLSDETFSDLQDQFGQPGEQGQGEQQGQQGEQGPPGGDQGQPGEQGDQEQGEQGGQGEQSGQQGDRGKGGPDGSGQQPGKGEGRGSGSDPAQGLAERQRSLREQLEEQSRNLPGAGAPGGSEAREALDRAGEAMDGAEQALRDQDYAGALDRQSEALEALREGLRDLAEQLAQDQAQQNGRQGQANGRAERENQRDPLGRDAGAAGRIGTDEELLQGEDVYRRAREILDEIRRRSAEQGRPDIELEYLKRLLDQF